MRIALVDNGSLEQAAHAGLRAAALAVGERAGLPVKAVSWKHSDRTNPAAWTLRPWLLAQVAAGEREFLIVPFFISPQGAVGSSLRRDLESVRAEAGGFEYSFADGLPAATLAAIVADRVSEASRRLRRPPVVVVDHGGPSAASAEVRDGVADETRRLLGDAFGPVVAASMESPDGPALAFNRPLLSEALSAPGCARGDVVIAPLFLLPGRHAGPDGDLERIARAAEALSPGLRCHFAGLVGNHPLALECLAASLARASRVPTLS
jgi:sirohydrochlorin ferrochelatase